MRRKGIAPMHDEHVNVTPLIDVIMCLIIFFLCCTTLAKNEVNDKVQIPRAEVGQELPEQRVKPLGEPCERRAAAVPEHDVLAQLAARFIEQLRGLARSRSRVRFVE